MNARKTNVFFSSGVNIPLRNDIKDILRFQEVNDLGHYLGAPLLHKRITNSTLEFLVERVRSWLSSWDAKLLSFEGRVTLAVCTVVYSKLSHAIDSCPQRNL